MLGEGLHKFDIQLCRHALDNVAAHMGQPAFVAFVGGWMEPAVLAYLNALDDDAEPAPLLLSDPELEDLAAGFGDEEFWFDRPWEPYPELYRRALQCAPDIREGLAREYISEWAQ